MGRRLTSVWVSWLAVISLLVASVMLPSAHQAPFAQQDPELVAFLSAGGSADDLCGTAGDHLGEQSHCPFCRLIGSVELPGTHSDWTPLRLSANTARPLTIARHLPTNPFDQSREARAPPRA